MAQRSRRQELDDFALVAAGAIPGALLRWWLNQVLPDELVALQSWLDGTLLANLLGCLLVGMLAAQPARRARLFLWGGIGFSGSLTSFSSWMLQLTEELQVRHLSEFAAALLVPLLAGMGLMSLGYGLGRRLSGDADPAA